MLNVVVDLSHYNTVTSWHAIRAAGIYAVIHKATQGISFVDDQYTTRKQGAMAAGLLWGAYHFGDCSDPTAQAQHFLDTIQPELTDLLVLDFEPCDDTMTVPHAEAFVEEIWAQTGRAPGLYSGQSFLTDCLQGATHTLLQACWLWLARYSSSMPVVPPLWDTWTMWQWTDQGTVPGISGPCDRNRFNGDLNGLYRLWGIEPTLRVG